MINPAAFFNKLGHSNGTIISIFLKSMLSQSPTLMNESSTVDEKRKRLGGEVFCFVLA